MTMIGQSGAASRALTRRSSYRGTTAMMRCMLAASAMLASGVAHAGPALPTGGTVTSGSATIGAPASGTLTINQSSNKAIINWNSFSIGQGGTVNFNNGSGATLNRVTGSASSAINGNLHATGSVYATGNAGIATTHTVGGLIGNNVGHVSNVYAAGHVTGAATKGALFGANGAASVVSNAYYDTLVTGSLAAIGSNANASVHPVALNASLSPTAQASYAGFDFSAIWMIASGQMPRLQHAP